MENGLLTSLGILESTVPGRSKGILLVADKRPTCNGQHQSQDILTNITAANTQGVSIHTFYLGNDASAIEFFEELAVLNDGVFVSGPPPTPPPPFFRRGDVNGDGTTDALTDAIFLLSFAFVAGSPPLLCLDAADVDDSGEVIGIIDSVFLLNSFFVSGSPPAPSPGPFSCGLDPTPDCISCASLVCP